MGHKRRLRRELYSTYVASHTYVADSAYAAPNFNLKPFFSQINFPITPPNFWKRGRGTRGLSENIIFIDKSLIFAPTWGIYFCTKIIFTRILKIIWRRFIHMSNIMLIFFIFYGNNEKMHKTIYEENF